MKPHFGITLLFAITLSFGTSHSYGVNLEEAARNVQIFKQWRTIEFRNPKFGFFIASRASIESENGSAYLNVSASLKNRQCENSGEVVTKLGTPSGGIEKKSLISIQFDENPSVTFTSTLVAAKGDTFLFIPLEDVAVFEDFARHEQLIVRAEGYKQEKFSLSGFNEAWEQAKGACQNFALATFNQKEKWLSAHEINKRECVAYINDLQNEFNELNKFIDRPKAIDKCTIEMDENFRKGLPSYVTHSPSDIDKYRASNETDYFSKIRKRDQELKDRIYSACAKPTYELYTSIYSLKKKGESKRKVVFHMRQVTTPLNNKNLLDEVLASLVYEMIDDIYSESGPNTEDEVVNGLRSNQKKCVDRLWVKTWQNSSQ